MKTRQALLLLASLNVPLHAANDTWLSTAASGDWSVGTNWVGGGAPGATSGTTNTDTATFNAVSTNQTLTVDAGRNLQNITFGVNSTYTLQGSALLLTSGGTILSNGASGDQRINSALQIQGDGGTYKIQVDTPGTNRELIIATGGITGASTLGNNTALTLTGGSTGSNAISAVIGNGSGGGTLSLVKEGASLWILSSGANTYSGGTTVTAGTLRSDNSGNSSLVLGSGTVTMNGGTLRFQSSSGTTLNNAIATTANGGFISFRANSNFNPASFTGTGAVTLTSDTNVTVTTTSFQNFAGTLNLGSGAGANFFRFGAGYAESSLGNAAVNLAASASLNHQNGTTASIDTHVGTLSGAAGSSVGGSGAGSGTFVFNVGSRNEASTFSGAIVDGGTKSGLKKVGTNTLILNGANTYTGTTTVSAGTLLVNGSLGATAVSADAGTFGGSGSVGGDVTVNAANFAAGASAGSLEVAGNLGLTASSTNIVELGGTAFTLNGSEDYDRTKLTGATATLTLGSGNLSVSLINGFTLAANQAFGILQLENGATRIGTFNGLANDGDVVASSGGYNLLITYSGNFGDSGTVDTIGGNDIVLYTVAAVPEPAAAGLGAIGMILLLRRRRA